MLARQSSKRQKTDRDEDRGARDPGRETLAEAMFGPQFAQFRHQLELPQYRHLVPEARPVLDDGEELLRGGLPGTGKRAEPEKQRFESSGRAESTAPIKRQRVRSPERTPVPVLDDSEVETPAEEFPPLPARLRLLVARLDAMFTLHLEGSAQAEPKAKDASEAHHADIGRKVLEILRTVPDTVTPPELAIAKLNERARQLEQEATGYLEDPVRLRVVVGGPEALDRAQRVTVQLAIAPNDWYGILVLNATSEQPQGGFVQWRWVVFREEGANHPFEQAPLAIHLPPQLPQQPPPVQQPAPIQGVPNEGNDCFLNACLQLLAAAYDHDVVQSQIDDGRIELRQLMAKINDPHQVIAPGEIKALREKLVRTGRVPSKYAQEDAEEVMGTLLAAFSTAMNPTVHERQTITAKQPANDMPGQPANPIDYPNDVHEHEQDTQRVIRVPLLGNAAPGLVPWLQQMYGTGVNEQYDVGTEFGHDGHQMVAITARNVRQVFTALGPILTFQLQRAIVGLKISRRFEMPETLTLVEHPDQGVPTPHRYRLRAFIVHSGASTKGGHYWAHRQDDQAQWWKADDRSVSRDEQPRGAQATLGELPHDIDHGYIYTYVRDDNAGPLQVPQNEASGTALDPQQLPPASRPLRGGQRQHQPASLPDRGGAKGGAEEPSAPVESKKIIQTGNMTGDMFVICAALRLEPSLSVEILWDDVYYIRTYEKVATEEGLTLVELYNRNARTPAASDEAVRKVLAARMLGNAERIQQFYLAAGIDKSRVGLRQTDTSVFEKGAYEGEFAAVKKQVHPDEGTEANTKLAVPGYATSIVNREFTRDRVGAENRIAGMFEGIAPERRRAIDEFRLTTVGENRVALLWSRGSSRNPGGGNPGLDMDPEALDQLRLRDFGGRINWIIGDPVPHASAELAAYIETHGLINYWERAGLNYVEQLYFLDQLRQHNSAIAIGMISGILELPAMLGMPTAYFELSTMRRKGKRWEKMAGPNKQLPDNGPVPHLNQVELSSDQEYAANLRNVLVRFQGWIESPADKPMTASPQAMFALWDDIVGLAQPMHEAPPAFPQRHDPDDGTAWRSWGLDQIKQVSVRLSEAMRLNPAPLETAARERIAQQIAAVRKSFAMNRDELGSLDAFVHVWNAYERILLLRAAHVDGMSHDPDRLVEALRGLAPQADIEHNGASITINHSITLAVSEVEERLRRDPDWLVRHLRVNRERTLFADQPLAMTASSEQVQAIYKKLDEKYQPMFQRLQEILGPRAFAGLVADLAPYPSALNDLMPFVSSDRLAGVVALIGPDATAGMIVEFRASPGRFVTFVDGVLAQHAALEHGEDAPLPDGALTGMSILQQNLVMAMQRDLLPPEARELANRPRTSQETSVVRGVQATSAPAQRLTTATGYSRGNGRELGTGPAPTPDVPNPPPTALATLPITAADRQTTKYDELMRALATLKIRNAGRAVYAELADAFYAAGKTASVPRFLTAHPGILDALGTAAGYKMDERESREAYGSYFQRINQTKQRDGASFLLQLCGATLEIVPLDTLKFSKPSPMTATMRLASTTHGSGARLNDGTVIRAHKIDPSASGPDELVGTFAGYREDGRILIQGEVGEPYAIFSWQYDVRPTGEQRARKEFPNYTIEEVEKMFAEVRQRNNKEPNTLAAQLQGIASRTVAQEVEGIDKFTVGDYLKILTSSGFDALIVGGAIRDIISGAKDPADIDIATTMPAVDALTGFEHAKLADRQGANNLPKARTIPQHGLTQVEHQVETGLDVVSMHSAEHGVHPMDLGTDVANRDFTFNALFYDPELQRIVDPTGYGLADLRDGIMRWTCHAGGDDAIRNKLRGDSYQVGRWIKFAIKGLKPPADGHDVAILNEVFAEHVHGGMFPEERARILDGIGKPLAEAVAKADAMGVNADLLRALANV